MITASKEPPHQAQNLLRTKAKSISGYGLNIRAAFRGAWSGALAWADVVDTLAAAVLRGYEQAWAEGAATCGLLPADRTFQEREVLDREMQSDINRTTAAATWAIEHSKANGFKLSVVMNRARLWTNRYNSIKALAQSISCADRKFVWRLGGAVDHCDDCLAYNGRVHRGSVWASVGAMPQSRSLACHGYNCQCRLEPTNQNATPGRPRRPTG